MAGVAGLVMEEGQRRVLGDEQEVEDPLLDGKIVEELQRGFWCGGRLVRPAVVRVGRVVEHASGSDGRKA